MGSGHCLKWSSDCYLGRIGRWATTRRCPPSSFFGPKDDPDPLVTQISECLKAIAASSSGPLNDKHAKRQLLASLDEYIYKEFIARALRLDTEIDKVDIEDIFAHVVEVWEKFNPNYEPKHITPSDHSVGVAYYGLPSTMDVQKLLENFPFHIDAANEMLNSIKDGMSDDEPPQRWPTPSSDKPTGQCVLLIFSLRPATGKSTGPLSTNTANRLQNCPLRAVKKNTIFLF
ncbi:hypothetical protein CYMTET_26712 [Cymbomonas tetramitiformis]|uniref:Uncharacterized protein n=1 Tax=Cymbomonas tetramitiformis TaxID=36881 RepID=A0AAE0KXZ5_9CHLO|nr:hypothetical protein CYMTET_26712 [Cymbomonas tetramitiformis]